MRALSRVSERAWTKLYRTEAATSQRNRCCYCGEPFTVAAVTADHVRARIWGGETNAKNIKAACVECNKLKGSLSDTGYRSMIKNPVAGDEIAVWMAWSRRRLWMATNRACDRIERIAK